MHGAIDNVGSAASAPEFSSRIAATDQDRGRAYRLRYDVYIMEQQKPYPEANVPSRTLSDELDEDGSIIVVTTSDDAVVGTVRANWFDSLRTFSRYERELELSRFSHIPAAQMCVSSRLAASPEHRHTRVRELLFRSMYEVGLERDTKLCFVTCAPALLRLFTRYGFREYAPPIQDRVVGTLHRTVLVVGDLDHFVRVGSPFESIARARAIVPPPQPWISRVLQPHPEAVAV